MLVYSFATLLGYLGGISHPRLVPMSTAEVEAARKETDLPPAGRRLFGMLDYTDEVFWWGTARTEDGIAPSTTAPGAARRHEGLRTRNRK